MVPFYGHFSEKQWNGTSQTQRMAGNCEISSFVSHAVRSHLHQASASILRQLYDGASDTVLIKNNRVT